MRKILAFLLAALMALSMTACGGSSESDGSSKAEKQNSESSKSSKKESSSKSDSKKKTEADYQTFDDLPIVWDVYSDFLYYVDEVDGELYLRCNVPENTAIEPLYLGFASSDSETGVVFVSAGEYTPELKVDDAFDSVYSECFIKTMKDYTNTRTWSDFTPDTSEHITINGRDVIKFTGVQEADDYGTACSYEIYGYCVVIENVPVIIAAAASPVDATWLRETMSKDDMVTIKHYADEMICTLRAIDHYEDYGKH